MGMMSALVWYVIPGLIGRAYDLRNETVGPDLYDVGVAQKARVIERYMTTSEYKVVSDMAEATDFLDISGKLSLKLKTGAINLEGAGNYLKETSTFNNKVDLLVKVHYETVTVTLPSDIKPLPQWEETIQDTGNTHYIRSIKYGGDLIASISFVTNNEADKEIIKGEIQGELSSKSGSFGGGLKGSLDKIQKKTKDTATMSINYFATVPLENVPRTIDGLTQLVKKFPEQTKKVNNGWGVPLQMEVFSLEGLSREKHTYYQTQAFADLLSILDEQFTDIRTARRRLNDWMKTIPPILDDEMNHKIGEFTSKLDDLDRIFSQVIGNLDLSSEASEEQFQPAFTAYQDNSREIYPDFYVNKLSFLKRDVLTNTPAFQADFGGDNYIIFGSDDCPPTDSRNFKGLVATTSRKSIGSSKFICLPEDQQLSPDKSQSKEEDEIDQSLPRILPVAYISRNHPQQSYVNCSSCRVPGKTTVTMLPGFTRCPEGWTMQYGGILVSTDFRSSRGELICLNLPRPTPTTTNDDFTIITEVAPSCDNFPCTDSVEPNKAIACVVCSARQISVSKTEALRF